MKRFLLVASIIISVFFLSYQAKAQGGNQTVVSGAQTNAINFPAGGCGYNWVNNTPGIGLAAKGTGDIPAFTAVNTGNTPITAIISVTPVSSSFAYVANYGSNNVSVINTVNKAVITTIPVGAGPYGVSVNTSGALVYVTNKTDNNVSVINTTSNTVVATIPVGSAPEGVVVSPDSKRVYVANSGSNAVSVIDATSNSALTTIPVDAGPLGIAESPDGSFVYVTNVTASTMSVINTSTNSVITTIPCGWLPEGITVSPDGSLIYVAVRGLNEILILNAADYSMVKYVQMVAGPYAIALSPDGSKAYVSGNGYFTTIFLSNYETMTSAATASNGISVTPDGSSVVSLAYSGVLVTDVVPYYTYTEITVGNNPISLGNFIAKGPGCNSSPFTFTITVKPSSIPPVITAGTATGTISACQGSPSASPDVEQFIVSGTGLTNNITATAPTGFEMALSAGGVYSNTVTIPQSGGTANNTIVYVRSAASATGNISGNVTLTSQGANAQSVAVLGKVNPLPTVNSVGNKIFTAGNSTTAINFAGTASTFNWVNNTPGIGLPASGAGNIPAFAAVNNGNAPVTATVTVTPTNKQVYAYIPNVATADVSVVDLATNQTVATIPVGHSPIGIAVSTDGSRAYITNQGSGSVSVINTTTNTVQATISLAAGSEPTAIAVSPDGGKIYVTNYSLNTVSVINTANNTVISTIGVGSYPYGIAISADGSKVYTANINDNTVSVINTSTNAVIATISVGTGPNALCISADGSRLYVANYNSNNVSVIDAINDTLITSIATGAGTSVAALSPDGKMLYVSNINDNTVSVINTTSNLVVATIPVDNEPYGLSVTGDGTKLYVAQLGSKTITVVNTLTNTVTNTINVGLSPSAVGNFISETPGCDGPPTTFTITINPSSVTPTIIAGSVTGTISACEGSSSVTPHIGQFTVSGTGLTNGIVASAPSGFQLSLSATGAYSNILAIPQSGGVVNNVTVYVGLAASATGDMSGNVTLSSQGASDQNVAVTGKVNPLPTVDPVPNQVVVSGSLTSAVHFTGTASNYNWAEDNASIGFQPSGGPDIPSFIATNTGNTPVISTFYVTPINLTTGCSGTTITFTIEVDPLLPPNVTTTGNLSPLSTTYGTASTSTSFSVSGTNMTAGILVTPPAGFEVSSDNTHFSQTVTIGSSGAINATTVYLRLTSKTPVSSYSGNVVLSSAGTANISVPIPYSVVYAAPLTIAANNVQKRSGETLTNGFVPTGFTSSGLQNNETIGSVFMAYSEGAGADAKAGTYTGSVVPSVASGGSFDPMNYTIVYKAGDIIVTEINPPITIPNAFTPNGDGINDVWNIKSLIDYPSCLVSIFTRYGGLIYQSRGYAKPWDGNYNGSMLPTGTYYYIIDLQNGQPLLSGYVALIR